MRYGKFIAVLLALLVVAAGVTFATGGKELSGRPFVIYMQMGGTQEDGATLARTNGARQAAKDLGVKVIEQYSQWQPEKMIAQFKEAMAAKPTAIVIMGHPGNDAFMPLVDEAVKMGIIVTSGNAPLNDIEAKYKAQGFGYAGVDLYAGGYLTGTNMITLGGLQAGDKAVEYGLFSSPTRQESENGVVDALTKAGVAVDKINITAQVDGDASLAVPVLTAYLVAHPDCKAIGTQHGAITSIIPNALKAAGKKPGELVVGGIDLAPATIAGLQQGWISATLDQVLYLQGYMPVAQCVATALYKIPGIHVNTAAGVVTPETIADLAPLIKKGIR